MTPPAGGTAYGTRREERRYVLGPVDHLLGGEAASWLIRLRATRVEGGPDEAVFHVAHEYAAPPPPRADRYQGELVSRTFVGDLTVIETGFPVELRFEVREDRFGIGEVRYSMRYVFEDGGFTKLVDLAGQQWDLRLPIVGIDEPDPERPEGLYPYLASHLRCLGARAVRGLDGRLAPPPECDDADLAFANPGLLSIAMPRLWASRGQDELHFFAPTGPDLHRDDLVGLRGSSRPGGATALGRPPTDSHLSWATDPRRYQTRATLRADERLVVEVGSRTVEAWRLDGGSALRAVWVDDDDRIVRVDLEPHPTTLRSRWIRMLHPAEF